MAIYVNGVKTNNVLAYSGGGSEHTYSTTEHVIGTWIDGSPIYEKTFAVTSVPVGEGWVSVGTVSGIDLLLDAEVGLKSSLNDYNYANLTVDVRFSDNAICVYNDLGGTLGTVSGGVTVRYTKASV